MGLALPKIKKTSIYGLVFDIHIRSFAVVTKHHHWSLNDVKAQGWSCAILPLIHSVDLCSLSGASSEFPE